MDKTCSYWRGGGLCYKEIQKKHEKWRDGASEDWIHEQYGVRLGPDDKWSGNLGIKKIQWRKDEVMKSFFLSKSNKKFLSNFNNEKRHKIGVKFQTHQNQSI